MLEAALTIFPISKEQMLKKFSNFVNIDFCLDKNIRAFYSYDSTWNVTKANLYMKARWVDHVMINILDLYVTKSLV